LIHTLSPKRAGYLPQVQSILKAVRPYWLSLPGSVSHEVGHDSEAGTIIVVETYESKDDVSVFEQSKEHEKMLARIRPFIEESKTTVTRLPASSAATRYR
jgi:quinol monooxygenase YgiN